MKTPTTAMPLPPNTHSWHNYVVSKHFVFCILSGRPLPGEKKTYILHTRWARRRLGKFLKKENFQDVVISRDENGTFSVSCELSSVSVGPFPGKIRRELFGDFPVTRIRLRWIWKVFLSLLWKIFLSGVFLNPIWICTLFYSKGF